VLDDIWSGVGGRGAGTAPLRRHPKVRATVAAVGLVAACVLVFLWQTGLPPRAAAAAVYSYGMIRRCFSAPPSCRRACRPRRRG
jgi:hypothetical protein